MKRKKMKKVALNVCLSLPFISLGQVGQEISSKYPAHIVYKIDDLISKVNLSPEKQIKIAQDFFKLDSLANISLLKGAPSSQLKSYYVVDKKNLKSILSAEEFDLYEYEIDKDNRFLVALKFANNLKLSTKQLSELREQKDYLYATPVATKKEKISFYNSKLESILTKEQYVILLQAIYKEQSIADAKKDWERINQLNIVSNEKNNTEYKKIENYHVLKNGILDLDSEKYDKKGLEKLITKIILEEPLLLIRANILSAGEFKNNSFASIIKYEKDIKLSENQINIILTKYKELEKIRFENEERDLTSKLPLKEPSEYEDIIKILSPEQINIWLGNKHKNQATKVALKNWKKLEMEGLIKDLDKEATVLDFSNYQLKFLIADEKTRMYNTPQYAFYKRDVEQKKPELLKQLDVVARNKSKGITTKNGLTW